MRRDNVTAPDKATSTDQMVLGQPGLIPQIGGHLIAAMIWDANIFVDHFSDIIYIHLMQSTTQEETLNAKADYERFSNNHEIKVC